MALQRSIIVVAAWVLVVALASNASGQSWKAEWEKTLAAAKKEGRVVVAGAPGQSYRDALTAFRKSYPDIQLEFVGLQGRDFGPRIVQERRAGQYLWDVHVGGAGSPFLIMLPNGVLDPLGPSIVFPDILDDSKWLGGFKDGFMEQEGKYIYGFGGYLSAAVFVNRDMVPESEFNKPEDLWNPKWKGKIVWHDPRAGGNGSNQAVLLLVNFGEGAVRRLLDDQAPVITEDYRQQVEWVAQGRYPIGIGVIETTLRSFQKEGVGKNIRPLKDPKLTSVVSGFGCVMAINRAPHPNAAKVYINWLLSQEGQGIYAKVSGDNSRRLDVAPGDPELLPRPGIKYLNMQQQEYQEMRRKVLFPLAKSILK